MSDRPSFESIYMKLAFDMASRSTCKRLQVGCVITSPDFRKVIAVGYNGGASGLENECESLEPGKCGHLHAECNAIINCDVPRTSEKIVFCTDLPCVMCAKMLVNLGGVRRVVYARDYRIRDALELLEKAHIPFEKVDEPPDVEERGLRMCAHLSGDQEFIKAIESEDRHTVFARVIFGDDEKLVDVNTAKTHGRTMRTVAKVCANMLMGGSDAHEIVIALHELQFDTITYDQTNAMCNRLLNHFDTFFSFHARYRSIADHVRGGSWQQSNPSK